MKKSTGYLQALGFVLVLQLTGIVGAMSMPIVDGFTSAGEYSNYRAVKRYNDHNMAGSKYPSSSFQETAVYYQWFDATSTLASRLYLYLEAPLVAKNMIWGNGWTLNEALNYYQHWCSPSDGPAGSDHDGSTCNHHKDGFAKFFSSKGDFGTMTGSEKTKFAGIEADLAGDIKKDGGYDILEYMDSVDYVFDQKGCDEDNCSASDIPMAFEFLFGGFDSMSAVDGFIDKIASSGIDFHLSPERGAKGSSSNVPVPEPTSIALLGIGLLGLGLVRRPRP